MNQTVDSDTPNLDRFLTLVKGLAKYDGNAEKLPLKGEKENVTKKFALKALQEIYPKLSEEELNHPKTQKKITRLFSQIALIKENDTFDQLVAIFGEATVIKNLTKYLEKTNEPSLKTYYFETLLGLFKGDASKEILHDMSDFSYLVRKSSKGEVVTIGQFANEKSIFYRLYIKESGMVVGKLLRADQSEIDPPLFEEHISKIKPKKVFAIGLSIIKEMGKESKEKKNTLKEAQFINKTVRASDGIPVKQKLPSLRLNEGHIFQKSPKAKNFEMLLKLFGGDPKFKRVHHREDFNYQVSKSSKGDVVTITQFIEKKGIVYRLYPKDDGIVIGRLVNEKNEEINPPFFETHISKINPEDIFALGVEKINEKTDDLDKTKSDEISSEALFKIFNGDPTKKTRHDLEGFSYTIRKSKHSDSLTISQFTKEASIRFRLYLKKEGTVIGKLLDEDNHEINSPIFKTNISQLNSEEVFQIGLKKLEERKEEVKKKKAFDGAHAMQLLASVNFKIGGIRSKAYSLGLIPSKRVGDYKRDNYKNVLAFINYYGLTDKIQLDDKMHIDELIVKIDALRDRGTSGRKSFEAMAFLVGDLKGKGLVANEDLPFFETYLKRLENEKNIYSKQRKLRKLAKVRDAKYESKKEHLARQILKQVNEAQEEELGIFLYAGFKGHCIDVEVIKRQGKYEFVIGNAGAGSGSNHRGVFKHGQKRKSQVIAIKRFQVEAQEDALKIIADILKVKAEPNLKAGHFYSIFGSATNIEDYSIPSRPRQKIGNCTVRSHQELLYYGCQRTDRTDLANAIQDRLQEKLLECAGNIESDFPGLKKEMENLGKKPTLMPLKNRSSVITLKNLSDGSLHIIPTGQGACTNIGTKTDMPISAKGQINVRHAYIREKEGRACIGLIKNPEKSLVTIIRDGDLKCLEDRKKMIALEKGDIIQFGDKGTSFVVQ